MSRNNRIFLTGFMGSGKSTLAPLIANVLGFSSIDIDENIEQEAGMTIAEMFRAYGEAYFRQKETAALLKCNEIQQVVIALGGGTVTFEHNLALVKSSGLLVYLKASPEIIIKRVKRKENRPMLYNENGATLSDEALNERIYALIAKREPFYTKANVIVDVGDLPVPLSVDRIVKRIKTVMGE